MENKDNKGQQNKTPKVRAGDLLEKLEAHLQEDQIYEQREKIEGGIEVKYHKKSVPREEKNGDSESGQTDHGALVELQNDGGPEETADAATESVGSVGAGDSARSRRSYEDDDYDLMAIFGFEEKSEDEEETETVGDRGKKRKAREIDLSDKAAVNAIMSSYSKRFKYGIFSLIAAVLLFAVSFFIEYSSLVGIPAPFFMNFSSYPKVAALLCLQAVVLAVALQYRQFFRSFRDLFTARMSPEHIFVLMTLALTVYYVLLVVFEGDENTVTFNSVYTLCAIYGIIHELMELTSRIYSLRTAASAKKKYTLVRLTRSQSKEERMMLEKLLREDKDFFALTSTPYVSGYAERSHRISEKRKSILYVLVFVIAFSVIFAFISVNKGSWQEAFRFGISALAFSAPLSLFFVFGHARAVQSRRLASNGSALIGEASFDEHGRPSSIVVSDREIFTGKGRIDLLDVHGYGDMYIDYALGCAAAVFTKLNCPLGVLFSKIAADYSVSADVDIAGVYDAGIEAAVDGAGVLIGKYDFLKKYGAQPLNEGSPFESGDAYLYIAIDRKAALRICFKYVPSPDFIKTVSRWIRKDAGVIIRTCDPNVNMKMLGDLLKINPMNPVRILKSEVDHESVIDRSDSGIIATGGIYNLTKAISGASKVRHAVNAGIALAIVAMLLGAVITATLLAIGSFPAHVTLYIIAYQIFWIIPVLVIDRIMI